MAQGWSISPSLNIRDSSNEGVPGLLKIVEIRAIRDSSAIRDSLLVDAW